MNVRTSLPIAQHTLGEIVTADSRAAMVLERFGLDFCCGGRRTLEAAARAGGIAVADVVTSLANLGPAPPAEGELLDGTDLSQLVDHIVKEHHAYVRSASPMITAWLGRLVDRHGDRHPELADVQRTFAALAGELLPHMLKEEHILFPAIAGMSTAGRTDLAEITGSFGSLAHPVQVMERDHDAAGDLLARLRTLTSGYTPPEDACTTYRLCYGELERFERDLHRHVHLENNVLFPRALALEQASA